MHKYSYVGGNPINYHDPTGWDAAIEEGELDSEISENKATEEGLEKTRDEVDCILDTATATLTAIVTGDTSGSTLLSIAIEGAKCTAEAKRNKGAKEPKTCPLCFAAGTPIHTDHGDVPVEKIEEGDKVLSRSRATGKLEYQRVTALTPKHQDSLLDIRVEGEAAPLRPSTSHPFWVKRGDDSDGAWIAAGKMRVGDLVQTIQGDWRRVVAITPEKDAQTVYNFTVDINHDYFVGDTGFLVHNQQSNCACGKLSFPDPEHVLRHGVDRPGKIIHGVFANEPLSVINEAWGIAVQLGLVPIVGPNGNFNYKIPFPEAGLQGGKLGASRGNPILDSIRIVTKPNCNDVVTAFPE